MSQKSSISHYLRYHNPIRSYSISDIKDYFEYIIKRNETVTDKPPVQINVSKIPNRVAFKIISGYYINLLIPETMKLLKGTEEKKPRSKIVRMNHI